MVLHFSLYVCGDLSVYLFVCLSPSLSRSLFHAFFLTLSLSLSVFFRRRFWQLAVGDDGSDLISDTKHTWRDRYKEGKLSVLLFSSRSFSLSLSLSPCISLFLSFS